MAEQERLQGNRDQDRQRRSPAENHADEPIEQQVHARHAGLDVNERGDEERRGEQANARNLVFVNAQHRGDQQDRGDGETDGQVDRREDAIGNMHGEERHVTWRLSSPATHRQTPTGSRGDKVDTLCRRV